MAYGDKQEEYSNSNLINWLNASNDNEGIFENYIEKKDKISVITDELYGKYAKLEYKILDKKYDLIISNPPYISYDEEVELDHEIVTMFEKFECVDVIKPTDYRLSDAEKTASYIIDLILPRIDFKDRENEIIDMLLKGLNYTAIGKVLGITPMAVQQRGTKIIKKMRKAYDELLELKIIEEDVAIHVS